MEVGEEPEEMGPPAVKNTTEHLIEGACYIQTDVLHVFKTILFLKLNSTGVFLAIKFGLGNGFIKAVESVLFIFSIANLWHQLDSAIKQCS